MGGRGRTQSNIGRQIDQPSDYPVYSLPLTQYAHSHGMERHEVSEDMDEIAAWLCLTVLAMDQFITLHLNHSSDTQYSQTCFKSFTSTITTYVQCRLLIISIIDCPLQCTKH